MGELGLLFHRHHLIAGDDDSSLGCQLLERLDLVVGHLGQLDVAEFDTEPRRDRRAREGGSFHS